MHGPQPSNIQLRFDGLRKYDARRIAMFGGNPDDGANAFEDRFMPHLQAFVAGKTDDEAKTLIDGAETLPNNLTGPWRLFVDDTHVLSMEHVVRTHHQLVKHEKNPVLDDAFLYGTVLPAPTKPATLKNSTAQIGGHGGYIAWYACPMAFAFCIATSADGLSWQKPPLGLMDVAPSVRSLVPPNVFWSRTNSHLTLGATCTKVESYNETPRGCRDTEPSVVYTPWDAPRTYKLFNCECSRSLCVFFRSSKKATAQSTTARTRSPSPTKMATTLRTRRMA